MASTMTKRGQADNVVTYEFVCDTISDLQSIEPKYITMGSIATVIEGESSFEVYMANSKKEWVSLGSGSSGSESNSNNNEIISNILVTGFPTVYYGNTINTSQKLSLNEKVISGKVRLPSQSQESATIIYNTQLDNCSNIKAGENDFIGNRRITGNPYFYGYIPITGKHILYTYKIPSSLSGEIEDIYSIEFPDILRITDTTYSMFLNKGSQFLQFSNLFDKLILVDFTEQDITRISTLITEAYGGDISHNTQVKELLDYIIEKAIEVYDISQIESIVDSNWDQAGE